MHHILGGAARHLALALGLRASTLAKSLPEQPAEKVCAALLQAPFLTGGLQVYFIPHKYFFFVNLNFINILMFIRYCNHLIHSMKRKEKLVVLEVQREVLRVPQYHLLLQFQPQFFQECPSMQHLTYLYHWLMQN